MTTLIGRVFRWQAKRPDLSTFTSYEQQGNVYYPLFANVSSLGLAAVASAFSAQNADKRGKKQIRKELKFILKTIPRWCSQGTNAQVKLDGSQLQVTLKNGALNCDLRSIRFWATHPTQGKGIVIEPNESTGFVRLELDDASTTQLVNALHRYSRSAEGTWTANPMPHPRPRYFVKEMLFSTTLFTGLINLAVLAICILFLSPIFLVPPVQALVDCYLHPDTFKPDAVLWALFAVPLVGLAILVSL